MGIWNFLGRDYQSPEAAAGSHFIRTVEPTFYQKWFGGILVPGCMGFYGVRCILAEQAVLVGRGGSWDLAGRDAILFGLAWLSGGLFVHFHYFWPSIKKLAMFTGLAKNVSLVVVILSLGYVIWSILESWG